MWQGECRVGETHAAPRIKFRVIRAADRPWIETWFQDTWLNTVLGPIDDGWFAHVLHAKDGVQLVAEAGDVTAGLIGVIWANPGNHYHAITDLAVNPALRRRGLGQRILTETLKWPGHPAATKWVAYVSPDNPAPARLLLAMGWIEEDSPNHMRRFRCGAQPISSDLAG